MEMSGLSVSVCIEAECNNDWERYVKVSGCDAVIKGSTTSLSADVKMKSLVVTDTRILSEANLYNTILCPGERGSDGDRDDGRDGGGEGISSVACNGVGPSDQVRIVYSEETTSTLHQVPVPVASSDGSTFSLQDEEHSETTINTDISTNVIDVYVSLDAIVDLLNVTMENVAAVTALMGPLSSKGGYDSDESGEYSSGDESEGGYSDDDIFLDTLLSPVKGSDDDEEGGFFTATGGGLADVGPAKEVGKSQRPVGTLVKKRKTATFTTTQIKMPSPKL
jgi:hypothetical protein